MLEDRWPNAETFDEATELAEKLIADDYESMKVVKPNRAPCCKVAEGLRRHSRKKRRLKQRKWQKLLSLNQKTLKIGWLSKELFT